MVSKITCIALAAGLTTAIDALGEGVESYGPDSRVEFRECPKCDKRIRIDLAAGKAYVNLARLEGANRDAVAARAAKLLDAAKIVPADDPKIRPLMGWSSWNAFGVDISEEIILDTARAMATNGLKDAGYAYVNIDDGFFWGHGDDGVLRFHPQRFPNGMKPVVDGIHALGLKAGIYSDAGADTCGSMWAGSGTGGKDQGGRGAGLYGHDAADCKLHFNDLGFDFIKVDYCGGGALKLDEKARYTEIAEAIKATGRTDVRLNLCRWAFPGTWAADIAESWRTTEDIRANWASVKKLIGENLYLGAYAKPGHYNDMDMLEVGQRVGEVKTIFGGHGDTGLTADEEVTHFGMWCMMSSPLLVGCDVRAVPEFTMQLITNPYLLAANQNDLGCQAYVARRDGDAYILVKDACERFGTSRYVALYNGGDEEREFAVRSRELDLAGRVDAFDLVEMADVGCFEGEVAVKVAPHASRFFRFDAERRVMRTVYEAEDAFLTDYQELVDAAKAGTAAPGQAAGASGGVAVRGLGGRETNDLVWKEVQVDAGGSFELEFAYSSPEDRAFDVQVDGGAPKRVEAPATGEAFGSAKTVVQLGRGVHAIRLSNAAAAMPDVDRMTLSRLSDWAPAPSAGREGAPMMTEWGERVAPETAWREYPRPQLARAGEWTCLNGLWDYAVVPAATAAGRPEKWDGKILVPFAVESPLSGVGRLLEPDEFLWYTRKIQVKKTPGRRNILNFESVDFRAQVFIGHREVTVPHESLNVPFSVDVTDYVEDGENELSVCVWDPTDAGPYGATAKQYIKPRTCFYTRASGILGTVWLESVPETYVTDLAVTPDLAAGKVSFRVKSSTWREQKVKVEVMDGGKAVASAEGFVGEDVVVAMPDGFETWSPESPKLYDATVRLGEDEVKTYFGMRSVGVAKDASGALRFALNGKPTFFLATLDQGWWPDGLLTPPSDEAMAYDVKVLKECGYNAVRKHIKVEPRRFYWHCDRMGILVIQDMPCDPSRCDGSQAPDDGQNTDTWRYGFYRRDLKRVIDHLRNSPSVVMWVPYNESWGQPGRFLTHTTLDWVKGYDPTRLVDGPSGWNDWEGGSRRTDYVDWKHWGGSEHMPEGVCEAADAVDKHDYGKKPKVFAANARRVSFLGEFGGINLKVPGHIWNTKGHFGYQQRASREELQQAYVDLLAHVAGLVPGGLGGCVYTQTTDVEIETNGLMTYDRRVLKFDPAVLCEVHARVRGAMD